MGVGIEVHKLLIGGDGTIGRRLVQTRFRRTLIERLADVEIRRLRIQSARIARRIFLKCLRGSLVVQVAILRHREHIQTLLSLITTLLHRHHLLQQQRCLLELATGKRLLGKFVLHLVVAVLRHSLVLRCAAAHQQG